jgi:hypothetical protein
MRSTGSGHPAENGRTKMSRLRILASGVALVASLVASLVALGIAATSGAGASSVARGASAGKVFIADKGCTGHAVEPSEVVIACADANLYVTGLQYSSYGGGTAKAAGTFHLNDCTPNCAAGTFHTHPGTITFSKVVLCSDGRRYYSRAKYRFKAKYGKGKADIEPTIRLKCK